MKRLAFFLIVILLSGIKLHSQEMEQRINFVISIDGNVVNSLVNAKFSSESHQIEVLYLPGELILSKNDFDEFIKNKNSFHLSFGYYEYLGNKQLSYHYEIELKKVWFEQSYRVLRIYNTDKKQNKKIFYPLEGKEYTYEVDLPSNSITRIRKK